MSSVRPAGPGDAEVIGRIAYATGFFGNSAAAYFPDRDLFAALWVDPYLGGRGCCNFVAESRERVVGYVIGSCSAAGYRRNLLRAGWRATVGILTGRYRERRRCLRFLRRMAWYRTGSAPSSAFPAHLHINLLPEARGQGLGSALLEAYLTCLRDSAVPGVQLATTRENRGALRLYRRFGFATFGERGSALWAPWLGRETRHLVLVRDLTASADPNAEHR